METSKKHDAWSNGSSYESYMGRWSRRIAAEFVDWLDKPPELDWLEIGCGSGALTSQILSIANPRRLDSVDPSEGFVQTTTENIVDDRLFVSVGNSEHLEFPDASKSVVVSGLVLNFIENRDLALSEMMRIVKPGGTVAFYVWDYPDAGVEFMRHFWSAAIQCDPDAIQFTEGKRFSWCNEGELKSIATNAELTNITSRAIEVPSIFNSFDDYWRPFTLGVGPAPGYCANLPAQKREEIRATLEKQLPQSADGSIHLNLRAWAVAGEVHT